MTAALLPPVLALNLAGDGLVVRPPPPPAGLVPVVVTSPAEQDGGRALGLYCARVALRSPADDRYVSTGHRDGRLRAGATQVGAWELYTLCYDPVEDSCTLRAANGRYLTAGTSGPAALLRAAATQAGPAERYRLVRSDAGLALRSATDGRTAVVQAA